jgi:hypothetical protein
MGRPLGQRERPRETNPGAKTRPRGRPTPPQRLSLWGPKNNSSREQIKTLEKQAKTNNRKRNKQHKDKTKTKQTSKKRTITKEGNKAKTKRLEEK